MIYLNRNVFEVLTVIFQCRSAVKKEHFCLDGWIVRSDSLVFYSVPRSGEKLKVIFTPIAGYNTSLENKNLILLDFQFIQIVFSLKTMILIFPSAFPLTSSIHER